MGNPGSKLVKTAAAVALCVTGAWLLIGRGSSSELPDRAEDAALFICLEDQTSFELTPRGLAAAVSSAGNVPLGKAPCLKCHKPIAVPAMRIDGKAVPAGPPERDIRQ